MPPIAFEQTPRQQLTARLDELAGALDGFPVQALMADCLDPAAAVPAPSAAASKLVDRVLDQWICRLGQDIDQLPPTTMDVLVAIGQRTQTTRLALIEVRRLFDRLADAHAQAPAPAPARDATAASSTAGNRA